MPWQKVGHRGAPSATRPGRSAPVHPRPELCRYGIGRDGSSSSPAMTRLGTRASSISRAGPIARPPSWTGATAAVCSRHITAIPYWGLASTFASSASAGRRPPGRYAPRRRASITSYSSPRAAGAPPGPAARPAPRWTPRTRSGPPTQGPVQLGDGATVTRSRSPRAPAACSWLSGAPSTQLVEARPVFERLFRTYGLPRIRSDNGIPSPPRPSAASPR